MANISRSLAPLWLLLLLSGPPPVAAQEDLHPFQDLLSESVYLFAEHLTRERDYLRATEEYRRYLFLAGHYGDGEEQPLFRNAPADILQKIGDCYQCSGLPGKALPYFYELLNGEYEEETRRVAIYEIAYSRTQLQDYPGALRILRSANLNATTGIALDVVNQMYLEEWEAARQTIMSSDDPDSSLGALLVIAERGVATQRKSPLLAGLMSTVIPGSGKMYAGEFADGLFSMTSVGLLAGLTYLGFRDEGIGSVRGWIYASLGAIFYVGNIYGSAESAGRTNARLTEALLNEVNQLLPPCWGQ